MKRWYRDRREWTNIRTEADKVLGGGRNKIMNGKREKHKKLKNTKHWRRQKGSQGKERAMNGKLRVTSYWMAAKQS